MCPDGQWDGRQAKMKSAHKTSVLAWTGVFLVALFSLDSCAPKPVPLGVTLDTPEHHMLSGIKLLELGRYQDALREFNLTKRKAPTFSGAYVGSGLVWAYRGSWEKASQEIEKAKELAKTDEEQVFVSVGLIRLFVIGKESVAADWLAAAEAAYNDAVGLMPNASEAHFYMGKAYEESGDLGKATVLFEKVLGIDKTHVVEARAALNLMKQSQGK
jgi:lipoprotein NlpI